MKLNRKYLVAAALLAVLAAAFGLAGTVIPLTELEKPLESSSSDSFTRFASTEATYDSGWVDIRDKCGQHFTLTHDLKTTEVIVDIAGKQSLDPNGGTIAWSETYGTTFYDDAASLVQTDDGGYALAGYAAGGAGGYDFWLVKTNSTGYMQWSRTYGGTDNEYASCVVQTGDGGYALAGYTRSYGAGIDDFWLVKTDSDGAMQWSQTYGGTGYDRAYSLVQTSEGEYALAGSSDSFGAGGPWGDFWLVKTDAAGNHQWNQTYGGTDTDVANSVVQTGDGGYALAGYTASYGVGTPTYANFWLVRTDANGTVQWNQTYGGTSDDVGNSLVQTGDGGYALAGYLYSGAGLDFGLVKTDSNGNHMWNQTYGGTGVDIANSVVQTGDGGYALAGYAAGGAGGYDFWLVKTDGAGNAVWNRTYGGVGSDRARSVVQTGDGGYALAGYTDSYGAGYTDAWLVKVNPIIQHVPVIHRKSGWSRGYSLAYDDWAFSLVQTADGGYALAGVTKSDSDEADFCLVKTNSIGTEQWRKTYGGSYEDEARSMVQTSDRGYALAGYTASYGVGWRNAWLVKTDSAGNHQWNQTYGGTDTEYAYSVVQTADGGYALAGETWSFVDVDPGVHSDFWLVKTNSTGHMQWNQNYGGIGVDWAYSVVQTSDGGYALAGTHYVWGGGQQFWLVKTDSDGNHMWNRTFAGSGKYASVIQTGDGGYALAGEVGLDFWLVKTDSDGNLMWNQTYGGTGYHEDDCRSLVQTSDGGYALAGFTGTYSPGYQFWLVKTDSDGTMQWNQTYGDIGFKNWALSVVQTRDGGYALAGSYWGAYWLVKTAVESGLSCARGRIDNFLLYRGETDPYWNYLRVRLWLMKEPMWMFGDINMDGVVDASDLWILSQHYGWHLSLLSLGGIVGILGIQTYKTRRRSE